MTLRELVSRYIHNSERVLGEITITQSLVQVDKEKAESLTETAKRYLEDARYYQKKSKLETSLASVAYCEGLLDALRLLGIAEFSWRREK
jgi:FAD synthetase